MKSHRLLPAISFVLSTLVQAAQPLALTQFEPEYATSILFIEYEGILYDGTMEKGEGTGFFVSSDGFALSVSHVVPSAAIFKSFVLRVRLAARDGTSVPVEVVDRDTEHDIVLLKAAVPPKYKAVPIALTQKAVSGQSVVILGFQAQSPLSVDHGIIRNTHDYRGFWLSDVAINPGSSGSPIFDAFGNGVGIAWGSFRVMEYPNGVTVPIEKSNYIIPIEFAQSRVLSKKNVTTRRLDEEYPFGFARTMVTYPVSINKSIGGLFPWSTSAKEKMKFQPKAGYRFDGVHIEGINAHNARSIVAAFEANGEEAAVTAELGCFDFCVGTMGGTPSGTATVKAELVTYQVKLKPGPDVIHRSHDVSEIKTDHPLETKPDVKEIRKRLVPEPGYVFSEAKFVPVEIRRASQPTLKLSSDGAALDISFSISSGSAKDPYNGWLFGSVISTQKRSE